ncbi:hypothetical protein [Lysobacter gummosus]
MSAHTRASVTRAAAPGGSGRPLAQRPRRASRLQLCTTPKY